MNNELKRFITKSLFIFCVTMIALTVYSNFNKQNKYTWTALNIKKNITIIKKNITHAQDIRLKDKENLTIGTDLNKWPWFLNDGKIRPNYDTSVLSSQLWPTTGTEYDRIPEQLMFHPYKDQEIPLKKIYIYNSQGLGYWRNELGQKTFLDKHCPVNSCFFTYNSSDAANASAVIFQFSANFALGKQPWNRSYDQVWILYSAESPYHTPDYKDYNNMFNWTMTYRLDSEIRWDYGRWIYYNDSIKIAKHNINFAANKTKKVAWFVSNCADKNGRLNYAKELSKYISVDIYGKCGTLDCANHCFQTLTEYKFYLAFENSNCIQYITEKLFTNAFGNQVLPIVMGARPQDYERLAPYKSFIHVNNFESAKHLADYLRLLDENDDLYNEYFQWRGSGEFFDTRFLCRLCALLYDKNMPRKSYDNLNEWWRGPGKCTDRDPWPPKNIK